MDIQEWQEIKKEFKEAAFKRVCDSKGLVFDSNDDVERELVGWADVELKPLTELFMHDIDVYGENAYLMWETNDVVDNNSFLWHLHKKLNLKRKTSAALPFDLERAKAGDVVEDTYDRGKTWVTLIKTGFEHLYFDELTITDCLRMKYPPKKAI